MIRVDADTVAVHTSRGRRLVRLPIISDREAGARRLVKLYDKRVRLAKAFAEHPRPTGVMAVGVMDAGRELDEACEDFRRRFYPRKYRVIVAQRQVLWTSRTNRSVGTVYDAGVRA